MPTICIDIETYRHPKAEELISRQAFEAPANYKDPAKIAEAINEKRKAALEKAALCWWTCQIICICAVPFDVEAEPFVEINRNESSLLKSFFTWLTTWDQPTLCGKSSDGFDIPVLVGRAMANDIGVPGCLRLKRPLTDIDDIFGWHGSGQRTSLDNYAHGLGIPGKTGNGAMVGEMFEAGKDAEIADYCLNDTKIVVEVIKRYSKPFGGSNGAF